jgi:glycosyltransferase involved in cell wall biosynthesis
MRILFVAPYPPSHIRVRAYSFVSYLACMHYVKVLVLCTGKRELTDVQACRENGLVVDAVEERRSSQYLRALLALCSHIPLQVAFVAAPAWRSAIEAELRSGQYDLLHVETLRALGALPRHLPIPVICDLVDCISHLYELGARAGATAMMHTIGMIEARRVRAYEQTQLRRFAHVLVTSEQERHKLLHLFDRGDNNEDSNRTWEVSKHSHMGLSQQITVLPNGVDQAYFAAYRGPRQAETLVFSGKLSYHANVAAALYLVEQILPRIWCKHPAARLVLAGCDPPHALRRLARDARITLTGYVADLRPCIAQAQVAVCPLPYAVGVQNKVLEAMALGTPVVASPCAVAGLQVVVGRDLLVADHPDAFASAVLHLLDSQALRQRLVTYALDYVANNHNWESLMQKLQAVYKQALLT